jgi:hypothetical protein
MGNSERAAQWNVIGGGTKEQRKPFNFAHDWALAKLAAPVCRGTTLKVEKMDKWTMLFDPVADDRVFMVAYH